MATGAMDNGSGLDNRQATWQGVQDRSWGGDASWGRSLRRGAEAGDVRVAGPETEMMEAECVRS